MSFRKQEVIKEELDTLLCGMSMRVKNLLRRDDPSVGDLEQCLRPFLLQAYRAGYYDGKGDAIECTVDVIRRKI